MNITFNLNVAARFFIVIFAHDFVKNGQVDLKLFHQIYWLAWMVIVGKKWKTSIPFLFHTGALIVIVFYYRSAATF